MRRVTLPALLAVAVSIGVLSSARASHEEMMGIGMGHFVHPKILLQTNVMYGVDGPFVGDNSPIRGEVGDDLPWEPPSSVIARLMTDGRVFIAVRGLVLGFDDVVPENMRGVNPDDTFRGMVSCLTEDGDMSKEVNVRTRPFKADAKGNSLIFDKVELPNPCVAPILFVIDGDTDVWFAVTGEEQEN